MKKLVIFCLIVLALGGGLCFGGIIAGGELYGSYYNGSLHSVRESVDDAGKFIRDNLHYREWTDADGSYHAGWYEDDFGADAVTSSTPITGSLDDKTRKLEFNLSAGSFRIAQSDVFGVASGRVTTNVMDGDSWELSIRGNGQGDEVLITLPTEAFEEIEINLGGGALEIDTALSAKSIELTAGAGKISANETLDARDLDLTAGAGTISASLAGTAADYSLSAKASMGGVTLNGTEITGGMFGTHRTEQNGGLRELDLSVGAGQIALFTEE